MSGLGNFGLNSLGSMSTLGTLAQSAQRLDRLMAGNRSRQQDRNNSRRSNMDDDFFGGRNNDRSRRRSPSPPRRFNRDDRHLDDRRDRGRRNRDDNMYGSSSGAGILGAAPSGSDRPSGLGDIGSTWNEGNSSGSSGLANLNTQTQQILNMMQTQQLLAAVQAQAKLANQTPPSLMGSNPGYNPRQGGRTMNQRGGGRFNRNDRQRQGGYNRRDERKRRPSPPPRPFKRVRKDDGTFRNAKKATTGDKDLPKKDTKQEVKGKLQAKGAEAKEKKPETSTESEPKITKNAAGEDIEELVKTNFDGKRYWCTLCKVVCLKSKNIHKHFMSERHVKAAMEKQGKVFDPEMMKQQELKQEKAKPRDVSEFLKYVCSTKQMARKEKNDIYISSLTDCTVKISDFATEQDFKGSEFVKAVSGFKCQLCKIFMRHGNQIIEHLKGKRHNSNYQDYLKENPEYLENQREVNKNLVEMLKKSEGKEVVLQESKGDIRRVDETGTQEKEEESDFNMDEFEPSEDSKVDDDSKMAGDSTFNDSAINESMQDSFNDSKEVCDEQESKSQPKDNDKEDDPQMKEDEVKKKEVKDDNEDLEGKPDEMDKEFSMEAEEEEEEFPLLEPPSQIKEDEPVKADIETKPEVDAKVPEMEANEPEVETKPEEMKTPETPSEPTIEPDETEDLTPSRRGRKAKRGRGGTRGTPRTRRRTPRAAKTAKKTGEIAEPEEVVDAPMEKEKEPEKEADPAVEEEIPSSQETGEITSSQEAGGSGVEGIDGFEVIDEVDEKSDDDSEDEH